MISVPFSRLTSLKNLAHLKYMMPVDLPLRHSEEVEYLEPTAEESCGYQALD